MATMSGPCSFSLLFCLGAFSKLRRPIGLSHTLSPEVQGSSLCFCEMGINGKVHSFSSQADSIWFLRRSQAGLKPVAMVVTCSLIHALLSFSPFATTSLLFHEITLQANYSDIDLISASAFGGTQKSTSGKLMTLGCQCCAQSDSTLRRGCHSRLQS